MLQRSPHRRLVTRVVLVMLLAATCTSACDVDEPRSDAGAPDVGVLDAGAPPFVPDSYCPGSAGCLAGGDGVLHAGAASEIITAPFGPATDVQTLDVNMDGEFDPTVDEFADRDGVPGYQGVWMAGFGNGRGARGVLDEQYARAIALRVGETTLVLVALDCVGYFKSEMDLVRAQLGDLDVDFVSFTATHVHEARDTIGLWGIETSATGLDPVYMALVRERTERAIRSAVAALRPANVQYASFELRDHDPAFQRWVSDVRDPIVIDDEVRVIRFLEAASTTTIATAINFGSHPEYLDSRNTMLSSDFVHWLRRGVEDGAVGPDGAEPGVGGLAVFFQGALGGQIGPGAIHAEQWDGTPISNDDVQARTEAVGSQLAYYTLRAMRDGSGAVTDETASIGHRARTLRVRVQNRGYHVAIVGRLFDRPAFYDMDRPIGPANLPEVLTEISVIDIGRARLVGVPGELDPSLFIGGYDGSRAPEGVPVVDPGNPNPPRLAAAPAAPYLRELAADGVEHVHLFGLTNDYLGYFVPAYDYVLDPSNPYLDEAPGDHYEETNSIGVEGWPTIERELIQLLAWRPDR